MSEILHINKEFIEENNKLGKTTQLRKKRGGPYTKKERNKRKEKVLKLRFLYG